MAKTLPLIGLHPAELRWIRMLVHLLRHPDPNVPALAREALMYLNDAAAEPNPSQPEPLDYAG